ncbi:MAG: TIGR04283 family arsenosugar biosynthesis glycosyltransferase [Saprospiraceae bacterium]|nr:TIGR04283 family arsenosugar biosynthesis glycosyltransferase [Saprospiraceae bacterium]
MKVSIIIPTLNEAKNIERVIERLQAGANGYVSELIVVDGGSKDETAVKASQAGAKVFHTSPGRALQMNHGVEQSNGDLLYFVHGDTLPPLDYLKKILHAVAEGYPVGCFRFRFDSDRWLLKMNAYFTRFDQIWCRGGDQSLFITREAFQDLGGYRSDYRIMEDYDLIIRAKKKYQFRIIPDDVIVSARKYETNSYLRVQVANFIVFNMFRLGYSQDKMASAYKRLLNYRY